MSSEAVSKCTIAPCMRPINIGLHFELYKAAYDLTVGPNSDEWWGKVAEEMLYWHRPFTTVRTGSFQTGDITWFPEGCLNASYNCVDRQTETGSIIIAPFPGAIETCHSGSCHWRGTRRERR